MGLIEKNKGEMIQTISPSLPIHQLNINELEFLLLLIKQHTFKGEEVELVYNTTLKLQNQYIKQKQ
jgi:hypothetical protein